MNQNDRILALREGGQTLRCHTMPYHGPYNVAIHSYNAVNLLLALHPGEPSLNLIKAVMWHDIPERWTGDVPSPAKWGNPELKRILDKAEERILEYLELDKFFKVLSPEETNWLTAVDLLELFIWGYEQVMLGNSFAVRLNERVIALFKEREDKTPFEVQDFLNNFKWTRNVEYHELIEG